MQPLDILVYLSKMADDADMLAMMGMASFGKQAKKRTVDVAARYESTKRTELVSKRCGLYIQGG